jgi:Tfp pilus assembly protein PilN
MIEINLLPGSAKKSKRRGLALPRKRRTPGARKASSIKLDRSLALLVGAWVLALGVVAYMHFTSTSRLVTLRDDYDDAVRDSVQHAVLLAQGDSLLKQEAIIAQKMQLIQEIDAGRYEWAHIVDELSRALPSYIWLVNVTEAASDVPQPQVRVEGRAGNYYALGKYIEDLEASPFIRAVRLMSSNRTIVDERVVLAFVIEFGYEEPMPDVIQTVPLFAATQEN